MSRRWVALVLTLVFAGPLTAPLLATSRANCPRCAGAARCCCAPAQGPGGCAFGRPCGPGSREDGMAAPQDLEKGLPEGPITAPGPPAPPRSVRADSPFEPADLPSVPPDPPPRASL